MSRETLVASTFVELADTWEDYFDVLDFLQNLVDRSVQILDASTACLTLADARGDLRLVASTSHALPVLDLIALSNAEGPGRDAFASGEPVINVPSADAVARWPRFVNAATELEFRATQVMPLRLRSQALGALMLLYADDVELTEDDQLLALAMVKIATIGMLQERTSRQRELLAERFQGALHERVVLEQAKGIVAEWTGLDMDGAFRLLSSYGRRRQLPLSAIAAGVVSGETAVDVLRLDP